MRNCLIVVMIVDGLLAVAAAPRAAAAPVTGANTAVAVATPEPAVQQVYWWRGRYYRYYWGGRYYPYYWGGHYYARRYWRYGRWYYY